MNDFLGRSVVDISQKLSFEELLSGIERKREGASAGRLRFEEGKKSFEAVLDLFPVLKARSELEFVICTAEREGILSDVGVKAEQVQTQVSKVGKRLTKVLKRRKK
jgi:hypothetical protein